MNIYGTVFFTLMGMWIRNSSHGDKCESGFPDRCSAVWQKQPEKWHTGNLVLHHDNAPSHFTLPVRNFWPETTWLLFSPSIPQIQPCVTFSFFLVPKLKLVFKGKRWYHCNQTIIRLHLWNSKHRISTDTLNNVRIVTFCILLQGNYCEGDSIEQTLKWFILDIFLHLILSMYHTQSNHMNTQALSDELTSS